MSGNRKRDFPNIDDDALVAAHKKASEQGFEETADEMLDELRARFEEQGLNPEVIDNKLYGLVMADD